MTWISDREPLLTDSKFEYCESSQMYYCKFLAVVADRSVHFRTYCFKNDDNGESGWLCGYDPVAWMTIPEVPQELINHPSSAY